MPARPRATGRRGGVDRAVPGPLAATARPARGLSGEEERRPDVSHDLRVEHWFNAPPEEVFDAYTDPDAQREWYEDQPGWIVEAECDLRVGGRWTVAFGPPGSEPYRETNVVE